MSPVSDRAPHRVRRRVSRGVVASVVVGLLAPLVIASPASADKISDMRKQAARMAAHLDDLEERADDLSEDYAQAVYELRQLDEQVAQAQAQSDRMLAQQCAEAARGMQVVMFDGSYPMVCDEKYKREFCGRVSTEEGFDLLSGTGTMPASGLTQLQSAGKACGVDPVAVQDELCAGAQKKDSLVFLARHCPDESAPVAQKECAGRTFTTPPAEKYREFCNTYAQHALRGNGDAAGAGATAPGGAGQDGGSAPQDGAVEKGKKALKKLLPF